MESKNKDELSFVAEQILTHRYWNTYDLWGDILGDGGMRLSSGLEILWNCIVMIIIQLQMW